MREDGMTLSSTERRAAAWAVGLVALGVIGAGCADSGGDTVSAVPGPTSGSRLAPGGAMDFGLFRSIVERGDVPAPETLDQAGFFAEHAIGTPASGCGDAVCAASTLGVMGNMLNGASCTLVRVALDSSVDPSTLPREPMHLVLVVDEGPATAGAWPSQITPGVRAMVGALPAGDRLTIISVAATAQVVLRGQVLDGDRGIVDAALGALGPAAASNLYDGLRNAFDLARELRVPGEQTRVVLVTAGQPTTGITSPSRLLALVSSNGSLGIATTVIGVGADPNASLLLHLGSTGAGNYYFVDGSRAAEEIFTQEVQTSLVPVATDVHIRLDAGDAFDVRGAYGVTNAAFDRARAELTIPALFLATRRDGGTSMMGPGIGRRGGGGAILFELTPKDLLPEALDAFRVGAVTLSYVDARTGVRVSHGSEVRSTYAPGQYPPGGLFADPDIEKAFVALNVYVGLRQMTAAFAEGDPSVALVVGGQLDVNLESWLARRDDSDIRSDRALVLDLVDNVERHAGAIVTRTVSPPQPRWSD